ncbi:unnamed protein product [Closterium sp. NIES-64]|nr:unnamed protein product [Closterium sp. NIES-64]
MGSREGYGSGGELPFMSSRARSQRRDLDSCSFLEPGNEFSRRPSLLNDNLDGGRPSHEFARRPSLLSDNMDPFRSSARGGPSLSSLTGSSLDPVDAALSQPALSAHPMRAPTPLDAAAAGVSGTGVAAATRSVERYMSYLSGASSRRPAAYAPPSALAIPSVAAPSGNALSPTSEPEGNMRRHRSRRRAMQEDRLGHLAGRTHMQHSRSANACERGFMSGGEGGPGRYERMSMLSGAVSESEGAVAMTTRAAAYLMRHTPPSGSVETSPEAAQAYRSRSDKRMGSAAAAAVAAVSSGYDSPTPPSSAATLAAGAGGMGAMGGMQAAAMGGPVPPGAGRTDGSMSDHSFMSARTRASLAPMHRRSFDNSSHSSILGGDAAASSSSTMGAGAPPGGLAPTPPVGPFEPAPPLVRRRTYSAADGSAEVSAAGMEQYVWGGLTGRLALCSPFPALPLSSTLSSPPSPPGPLPSTLFPHPPPSLPSPPVMGVSRGRRRTTAPEVSDEVAKKVREYNEAIRRDRRALRVETATAAAGEQQLTADGSDLSTAPSPLPPTSSTSCVSTASHCTTSRILVSPHPVQYPLFQHWPLTTAQLSPAIPATAATTPSTATTPAATSAPAAPPAAAAPSLSRDSSGGGPGQLGGDEQRAGEGGGEEAGGMRPDEGDAGGTGEGGEGSGEGQGIKETGRADEEERKCRGESGGKEGGVEDGGGVENGGAGKGGKEVGAEERCGEERGGQEKAEEGRDGEEGATVQQGENAEGSQKQGAEGKEVGDGEQSGTAAVTAGEGAGGGAGESGGSMQRQRPGMSHRSQPSFGNTSGSSGYVSPLQSASPRPHHPASPPPPASSHPASLRRPTPPGASAPGSGALSSAPGSQHQGVPAAAALPAAPAALVPVPPVAAQAVLGSEQWTIDFNELRLGIRVGIGSFGEVFRAVWRGTEVAVKRLLVQDDPSPEEYEDFYNEAPQVCMVTEYMHMGSLYRIIHSREPGQGGESLSWKRRYKMLRDICRGMLCVQRMSIVHRDLKSANCLVDKHWCVKICDFGLSRLAPDGLVLGRTAAGTPEWMAPELLRNEPCSFKCDVFSMGVIMWELVTLRRPWEDVKNPLEVAYAVAHRNARLPVPDGMLGQLIADCWEDDPERRPNFEQILERLHECEYLDV